MSTYPSGTVTFLFTDIEDSTKLAQEHRETWEPLRTRHDTILQSTMDAHNGYVFQIIGDAFCVGFHNAGDAVRVAVKSQTAYEEAFAKGRGMNMAQAIAYGLEKSSP
jgi:class 3 adenylate cyclase